MVKLRRNCIVSVLYSRSDDFQYNYNNSVYVFFIYILKSRLNDGILLYLEINHALQTLLQASSLNKFPYITVC